MEHHLQHSEVKPFTPAWYAQHPKAWHWTHPHADAWAVAAWTTLYPWVGAAAQPVAYYGSGDSVVVENIVSDGNLPEEAVEQSAEIEETEDLAETKDTEWLPLGVFALLQPGQEQSNVMVQMAVDHQGKLKGNYFDILTNTSHPLQGSVDANAQKVNWTIADNTSVVYETGLNNLTRDEAPITVAFPGRPPQDWTLVRLQPPTQPSFSNP